MDKKAPPASLRVSLLTKVVLARIDTLVQDCLQKISSKLIFQNQEYTVGGVHRNNAYYLYILGPSYLLCQNNVRALVAH